MSWDNRRVKSETYPQGCTHLSTGQPNDRYQSQDMLGTPGLPEGLEKAKYESWSSVVGKKNGLCAVRRRFGVTDGYDINHEGGEQDFITI